MVGAKTVGLREESTRYLSGFHVQYVEMPALLKNLVPYVEYGHSVLSNYVSPLRHNTLGLQKFWVWICFSKKNSHRLARSSRPRISISSALHEMGGKLGATPACQRRRGRLNLVEVVT